MPKHKTQQNEKLNKDLIHKCFIYMFQNFIQTLERTEVHQCPACLPSEGAQPRFLSSFISCMSSGHTQSPLFKDPPSQPQWSPEVPLYTLSFLGLKCEIEEARKAHCIFLTADWALQSFLWFPLPTWFKDSWWRPVLEIIWGIEFYSLVKTYAFCSYKEKEVKNTFGLLQFFRSCLTENFGCQIFSTRSVISIENYHYILHCIAQRCID